MTLELACINLTIFIDTLNLPLVRISRASAMDNGRYHCFTLLNGEIGKSYTGKFCYVEIPGTEMVSLRGANKTSLSIDGAWWLWPFAIEVVKDILLGVGG